MIKSFGLLARRPDLTEEQFHQHWSTVHREHALRISTVRRYVQFHIWSNRGVPGFPTTDIDGIPETWWDEVADIASLGLNPEYADHAGPDEANFIDPARKGGVVASERVRIAGDRYFEEPAPGVKVILLLTRAEGTTDDQLEAFIDGPWSAQVAGIAGLVRHVDSLPVRGPGAPRRPSYDVVAELWFASTPDLEAAATDFETLARSLAGSPVDLSRSASVVGDELRALWPEAR